MKRVKRWVDFVKRKHAKLEPPVQAGYTRSIWRLDAFVRQVNLPGQTYIPWLKKNKIDVSSFPTLFAASEGGQEMTKRTARTLQHKVRLLRQTIYKAKLHI